MIKIWFGIAVLAVGSLSAYFYANLKPTLTFQHFASLSEKNISSKDYAAIVKLHSEAFIDSNRRNLLKYYQEVVHPDVAGVASTLMEKKVDEMVERSQKNKKESFREIENAFIARRGEEVVGFFDCYEDHEVSDGQILISNLCVKKSLHGQGIGTALTKHAIAHCRKPGKELILTVYKDDLSALHVYEKLGFEKIDLIADPKNPFVFFNKVMMRYRDNIDAE